VRELIQLARRLASDRVAIGVAVGAGGVSPDELAAQPSVR